MIQLNTQKYVNYNVWSSIYGNRWGNDLNYAQVNVTNVVWKNVWHNVRTNVLDNVCDNLHANAYEDLRNHTKQI